MSRVSVTVMSAMSECEADAAKRKSHVESTRVLVVSARYFRHRAREIERSFLIRAFIEQVGLAVGIALCALSLSRSQDVSRPLCLGLMLIGLVYVYLQWRGHSAVRHSSGVGSSDQTIRLYRQVLERTGELHRTFWRWHVLPMTPGLIAIFIWQIHGDGDAR